MTSIDSGSVLEPLDERVDHVRGESGAPVILEYGDYECPYSRQAFRSIERVERELSGHVRFAFRNGHPHRGACAMNAVCTHLDSIEVTTLPDEIAGCEDCLAIGDSWVHLRMCMTCGKIGCCDSSPNRHATAHAYASGHPIICSVEPGEDWNWCYVDEITFVLEPS